MSKRINHRNTSNVLMMRPNALSGDLGRAQQRIRNLADLAARNLCVESLNALNVTIAVYLPAEIYEQVRADLESEQSEATR